MESIAWVFLFAIPVVLLVGWCIPWYRPMVRKYGWLLIGASISVLGVIFLRRRPGRSSTIISGGRDISDDAMTAVDSVMESALASAALADARLSATRIKSAADRARFESRVDAVELVDDSVARREALIKLVQGGS